MFKDTVGYFLEYYTNYDYQNNEKLLSFVPYLSTFLVFKQTIDHPSIPLLNEIMDKKEKI